MRRGELEDALSRIETALVKATPLAQSSLQLTAIAVPETRVTSVGQRAPLPARQRAPELVSNGAAPARLFYTAPEAAGVGQAERPVTARS